MTQTTPPQTDQPQTNQPFHQSMTAPLRRVLVRRPDQAFAVEDPEAWHYAARPDLAAAQAEHDAFTDILRKHGAEVVYHDMEQPGRADSVFVYDPALITREGAILLNPGKALRQGEQDALGRRLEELGVPVLGRLTGEQYAEGGDMFWLDDQTLAIGRTFRTTQAGVDALRALLEPRGVEVQVYDMPVGDGADACLHLMSVISPVAPDAAVVYPRLMPVPLWQELQRRGLRLIEVPDAEFPTQGSNVLAITPAVCLMLAGNPVTRTRLEDAGFTVESYVGNELSLKAEGGPTCLTKPLVRRA
ncbi:amidinotransferase (plasmid) [Deinococcus metallilatus]|uniref:N-dimethylarginine dimethylaminohydrolase n=1 Tax=Deinococcus metallilatus TaxID=1211322 RepID=A0ABR6MQN0_9DEIO|nr:arginine deiminase family protein [Deinococcus metallilatus]MBB5293576.1 N-dimethylarginine dimethylaminohydrolase [Deinococcus metallilatus]QBY06643.1 amidinotransferase [Deinococcus metallilatus]RXJ17986.1 amidinotransferase [Deinococcus metallilatus]GMA15204.1 amidinotransferase [Deinococcus metallilatus]